MAAESTEIGFSMADNNTSRFRSSDPFGRGSGASAPANDPLAELARLIGQNDPFAEFGARPGEAQPDPQDGYDQYPTQPYNGQPTQAYQQEPVPQFPEELPPLRFGGAPQARQPAHDDWPGASPAQSNAYHQPAETYGVPPPMRPVPGFDMPSLPEPVAHAPADDYYRSAPPFDTQRGAADPLPSFLTAPGHPSQPSFAQQPYAQQPSIYPPQADTGAMPAPHDDEFYDDAPRPRRRGLLTVAAVLLLAVVGTAGAVAYRNYFGGPSTSGPPPVIRASADPSKVPPPAAKASSDFTKDNYERFPERSKDERIVGREEKPIDQKDLGRSQNVSVATPPSRPNASAPPNAIGPTRQVRTVAISPNSGDMAVNTPSTTPDTGMLPSPPQTGRPSGVQFPPPPSRQQVAEAKPDTAAPPPAPRSTTPRTVTTSRVQPAPAPVTSGNAPLSLSPDGQDNSPPPQASAYRDTTPPPPSRQANAAPVPRATASSGGRFHVQVASQKSESDAESSFHGIQSKYSGVLGGQPHIIRRADLGTKGTYYRAMVGPFTAQADAIKLCSSLKSAGGSCLVQRN